MTNANSHARILNENGLFTPPLYCPRGEQIKNSIVVLSKILQEMQAGVDPYQAIIEGSVAKLRPVMMIAITTVLGMIPLTQNPFFASMAVAIMFCLSFACVLTLLVAPVLFAIFYGIHEPAPAAKKRRVG
jgi:multidrug efflux pump subunit AcrB